MAKIHVFCLKMGLHQSLINRTFCFAECGQWYHFTQTYLSCCLNNKEIDIGLLRCAAHLSFSFPVVECYDTNVCLIALKNV